VNIVGIVSFDYGQRHRNDANVVDPTNYMTHLHYDDPRADHAPVSQLSDIDNEHHSMP